MRLDKFLWELGSRSEIKKLLKSGTVTVDGVPVKDGGFQVKDTAHVCYMGKEIFYREFIYIITPSSFEILTNNSANLICIDGCKFISGSSMKRIVFLDNCLFESNNCTIPICLYPEAIFKIL